MDGEMQAVVAMDRRVRADRRRVPHMAEWRWLFGGRRGTVRRANERRISRLDVYPAPLLGASLIILLLSTLDAGFTLYLVEHGVATEANPLMAGLLDADVRLFGNLKTALTGSCLILLVLYSEQRFLGRIRAAYSVYALAGFYTLLVGYEIALLTNFWSPDVGLNVLRADR